MQLSVCSSVQLLSFHRAWEDDLGVIRSLFSSSRRRRSAPAASLPRVPLAPPHPPGSIDGTRTRSYYCSLRERISGTSVPGSVGRSAYCILYCIIALHAGAVAGPAALLVVLAGDCDARAVSKLVLIIGTHGATVK